MSRSPNIVKDIEEKMHFYIFFVDDVLVFLEFAVFNSEYLLLLNIPCIQLRGYNSQE